MDAEIVRQCEGSASDNRMTTLQGCAGRRRSVAVTADACNSGDLTAHAALVWDAAWVQIPPPPRVQDPLRSPSSCGSEGVLLVLGTARGHASRMILVSERPSRRPLARLQQPVRASSRCALGPPSVAGRRCATDSRAAACRARPRRESRPARRRPAEQSSRRGRSRAASPEPAHRCSESRRPGSVPSGAPRGRATRSRSVAGTMASSGSGAAPAPGRANRPSPTVAIRARPLFLRCRARSRRGGTPSAGEADPARPVLRRVGRDLPSWCRASGKPSRSGRRGVQ